MLFPTFTFILAFLPVTAIIYFLLAKRNILLSRLWLLVMSFIFYSWFNWSYSLILGASILGNWLFALLLKKNPRRAVFILGVILNILLLGYFKYYDFFVENINAFFGTSLLLKHILLPLGISFFTFQQISFLQLVYTGSLAKDYSFSSYALFVSFFPQLIAGPIVLPDEMMSQFDKPENSRPNGENIARGLYTFALGLGKKILLADFFAEMADAGFAAANGEFFSSWQSALAYSCQIYFDFSGYCDMAVGIGWIFNIKLPQNFNAPYLAANIRDFWRRWHITLGRFLTGSIYIPLGGSRCSTARCCLNLLITFFISGLWHGASWLFVLWGMLHGFALVIHRLREKFIKVKMPLIPARLLTFFFTVIAWVAFRAADFAQAKSIWRGMFIPESWGKFALSGRDAALFIAAAVIITCTKPVYELSEKFRPTWVNAVITTALLIVSMFFFVKVSPFIYFNF